MVGIRVLHICKKQLAKKLPVKNIDTHRGKIALRYRRLLNKLGDTVCLAVSVHNTETAGFLKRNLDNGEVTNSVVFTGAKVRPGAKVIDSVLMPGAIVEDGAVVIRALVANGVNIGKGALVGSADSEHIELIARRVKGAE